MMRRRDCLLFSSIIMFVTCAGCSVNLKSQQFEYFKGLLQPRQDEPQKNWLVTWRDRDYHVYAINHGIGTYFANEQGLIARFDGSQVVNLSLPGSYGKNTAVVSKAVLDDGSISLKFLGPHGDVIAEHSCSSWRKATGDTSPSAWTQQCLQGSQGYSNEIQVNASGLLVALKFVLLPNGEAIAITLR